MYCCKFRYVKTSSNLELNSFFFLQKYAPICLGDQGAKNMRLNLLKDEIDKAENNTAVLGKDFVNNCPPLQGFEKEYVLELTGTNR